MMYMIKSLETSQFDSYVPYMSVSTKTSAYTCYKYSFYSRIKVYRHKSSNKHDQIGIVHVDNMINMFNLHDLQA